MLSNQSVINEKPRDKAVTSTQGGNTLGNGNSTMLRESKSRYEKGIVLYKQGKASIGSDGFFKVSGFQVDTEKMTCTCPDYKTRKEVCKHLFAALLFVKNRGKQTIEDLPLRVQLEGFNGNGATHKNIEKACGKRVEPRFDRQSTITRLAVLNTATEIIKTWGRPVEFSVVVSLASQLEKWALEGDRNG